MSCACWLLVAAFASRAASLAGVAVVAALLLWEHSLVKADDLSRVNAAFFTMNGYVSVLFFVSGPPISSCRPGSCNLCNAADH